MAVRLSNPREAAELFGGWQEAIIWSCLQDIMGAVYADRPEKPQSAAASLGDFCFLAGRPDQELIKAQKELCGREFQIMVPQTKLWSKAIEIFYGERARRINRYAIRKEPDVFDKERLCRAAASLRPGYELKQIDRELYAQCRKEEWSRDLVSQFADYEEYQRLGLGIAALRDGRPVSGASSYARYRDGIEIEIDTRPECRRKGLAFACGAGLILECLKRGLYPSWDAHSMASVSLAEKLGYHFSHEYPAYETGDTGRQPVLYSQ